MHPKYKHDCTACEFKGHFNGFDVWVCPSKRPSIIARAGDTPGNYACNSVEMFVDGIKNNEDIGIGDGKVMKFQDYIFSEHCIDYHKAWLLALATR